MPVERFFVDLPLLLNETVRIEEQEFHHLVHVTRQKVGNEVELINGKGTYAQALFEKLEKHTAWLKITQVEKKPPPSFDLILAQAIPRMNRLDTIIEKVTECDATEIWLFPGDRSERAELSQNQLERLCSLAIAAIKQCGRLYLPKILIKPPLRDWAKLPFPAYFGDVRPNAPRLADIEHPLKSVVFFIGPESGFSDHEVQHLESMHAKGVSLHRNILRTDTASIGAIFFLSLERS